MYVEIIIHLQDAIKKVIIAVYWNWNNCSLTNFIEFFGNDRNKNKQNKLVRLNTLKYNDKEGFFFTKKYNWMLINSTNCTIVFTNLQ